METLRVSQRTGKDGVLHLSVPLGTPDADYDVVLVVEPKVKGPIETAEERGWPPGYFEGTFGSITDPTFARPAQGELPKPVELE